MKTLHDSLYAVRHSDSQGTAMRPSCPRMPTTDASACNRVMTHAPKPRRRHAIVRIMRTMAGMMRLSTGVDGLRIECKSPAERRGFMFASAGNRWACGRRAPVRFQRDAFTRRIVETASRTAITAATTPTAVM